MNVRRYTVPLGLASLVIIPSITAAAGTLRDEAVDYRTQGYELQQRGEVRDAMTFYQKAAALDPTYPTPHNDLGVLYEQRGLLDEAEAAYKQALVLNASYLEPHANLAMLYEQRGQRDKAIYHWMRRYDQGESGDPGTLRAEERLIALGALTDDSAMHRRLSTRHLIEQEFQVHQDSKDEAHAVFDKFRLERMAE